MSALGKFIYVGEYQHFLDSKHRLTIPSKWRFAGDQEDVYLAIPSPTGCILVYPPKMVGKLEEKVSQISLGNKKGQKALMNLFSKADTFGCDKNGRIVLSEKLISHASLAKEVVLVGSYATFSIWNPEKYQSYIDSSDDDADEMSKILTEIGL